MSFADLPSPNPPVQLLQRSLGRGRLAHAYLFSGASLGLLELVARTLAQVLNCLDPGRGASGFPIESCDRCLSCRKIEHATHPDVHWIRPESKSRVLTIDQIRDLMHAVQLKPMEARTKVAVLVAADRLNQQAANAFLKTLEEPPDNSLVILLTTKPERVLETLLSRCLRLHFGAAADAPEFAARADWIRAFAQTAAKPGGGFLGRYHLLNTLVQHLSRQRAHIEQTLAAESPLEQHDDLDPKLKARWEDELDAAIEAEYRRCRSELLAAVHLWLRDVWLQSLSIGPDLLEFPSLASDSAALGSRIPPKDALANLQRLDETQRLLETNVQEVLTLEVGLLKLRL